MGKKQYLINLYKQRVLKSSLAVKFVGTKRFGLDGGESLIPALEQIIKRGGHLGFKEVKNWSATQGKIKYFSKCSTKSYKRMFNEFAGEYASFSSDSTGDVKYHLGASSNREFDGNLVHVSLTDNPSHLEAVNPVVLGQTRLQNNFFIKMKKKTSYSCLNSWRRIFCRTRSSCGMFCHVRSSRP